MPFGSLELWFSEFSSRRRCEHDLATKHTTEEADRIAYYFSSEWAVEFSDLEVNLCINKYPRLGLYAYKLKKKNKYVTRYGCIWGSELKPWGKFTWSLLADLHGWQVLVVIK